MSGRAQTWPVPFARQLQGQWVPGQSLFVQGFVIGDDRFVINLSSGPNADDKPKEDVPLHISCRLPERKIVLNDHASGWGSKEIRAHCPFKKGEEFDIRIRAHEQHFELFANGKEIAVFPHRHPLSKVVYVYIYGDVELHRVSWEGRYYAMPFQSLLSDGFTAGKVLYVSGVVLDKADKFAINFHTSTGDIAFHFNPRFGEKKIVRNSCRNNAWDAIEEREGEFSFKRGHVFDIIIQCQADAYYVFANGQPCCSYSHRLPVGSVKGLSIEGDVELQGITFDEVDFSPVLKSVV